MAFDPTDEQLKVINHDHLRHGRVLAGPGTGKSSTAIEFARRLASLKPTPSVKFITFTRAATAELGKKAFESGQAATSPSTLHSFAISVLLRNEGAAPISYPLRIPDDWEQSTLITAHLTDILKNSAAFKVSNRNVKDLFAEMAAQWESLDPELQDESIPVDLRNLFSGVFNAHRRTFGYTLLSELPNLLRGVLESREQVNGIGHDLLLVDEYQDLNACDLAVLKLLAERGSRIVAVGDDDQSIYSFRKAHPEGIRRFLEDYPQSKDYELTFCHRLNQEVGAWAQFVIGGDPNRTPRKAPSYAPDAPLGHVALLSFPTVAEETAAVTVIVRHLIERHGLHPSDIAILFRGDYQRRFSKPIADDLRTAGVPVVDTAKATQLMESPDARRVLAILQLLRDPADSLAWWALMEVTKGVGAAVRDELFGLAQERNTTFGRVFLEMAPDFKQMSQRATGKVVTLYAETIATLDRLAELRPVTSNRWGGWVADLVTDGVLPQCSGDLLGAIAATDDLDDAAISLEEFVSRFGLRLKEQVEADQTGVRCMTMAASKGLTVRASILVAIEDDVIPRPGQDLHEERRLLYVAMTRAKEHLFLTWVEQAGGPRARTGRANFGQRRESDLLSKGPIKSRRGRQYLTSSEFND